VAGSRRSRGLAGAALITLLLFAAPAALAAFPGANGRISYQAPTPDFSRVDTYAVNPNGSDPRLVVRNARYGGWSPDGARLAFTREAGACHDIFVVNADGSGEARLTNGPGCTVNTEPSWSPDGARIAFRSHREALAELYVMNADGSNQVRLTDSAMSETAPAWSPDGRKIAFSGFPNVLTGRNTDIYTVNPDGSGLARLTTDPNFDRDPDWSPDGSRLAFERAVEDPATGRQKGEVFTVNADGSGYAGLITGTDITATSPAWSPDGRRIAYTFGNRSRPKAGGVYASDADGTNRVCVVIGAVLPAWQPAPVPAPAERSGRACTKPGKCSNLRGKKRSACIKKRCGKFKKGRRKNTKKYKACVKRVTAR
jgi:Tol biopolymer transport system component